MSNSNSIEVKGVSKKYCKNLKKSIAYGLTDIAGSLIGTPVNSSLRKEEFWAVNNLSFNLEKGESLGIIGPNGSGKSTLLKLLNGIFMPDKGTIKVKGKVGALIEVGAGFHPLLTGRENIYINGAILGMTKREIDEKFNDIVQFADIGDFLDAPVKTYSSGMFVRLGFAIAVHCEPDILLVDEVLAVGDSVFRQKCYRKMNDIKKYKNASIIFVSHDLYTVRKFCDRGILLNKGIVKTKGEIVNVIENYQSMITNALTKEENIADSIPGIPYATKEVKIISVKFLDKDRIEKKQFAFNDTLIIRIEYDAKNIITNPRFQLAIRSWDTTLISVFGPHLENIEIPRINKGKGVIECWIEKLPLLTDKFYVNIGIYDKNHMVTFDWWSGETHTDLSFKILPNKISAMMGQFKPLCYFHSKWVIK